MSSVSYEQICVFFITPRHPELDSGSHFYFSNDVWFFLSLLCFYFFIKIITTSSKERETARSPKPAVSLPLNPSFFGHGLGRRPKNPLISEVSSVSCEQICVFFSNDVWFFSPCHPERCASSYALASKNDSGSHFFLQTMFDFFYHFFVFTFL